MLFSSKTNCKVCFGRFYHETREEKCPVAAVHCTLNKAIVEKFRIYIDFFNLRFKSDWKQGLSPEEMLKEHEKRVRRQLDILLHGVLDKENR